MHLSLFDKLNDDDDIQTDSLGGNTDTASATSQISDRHVRIVDVIYTIVMWILSVAVI